MANEQDGAAGTGTEPDRLSRKQLAREYGYAVQVIYANDELRKLFERALNAEKGQWSASRFQAAIRDTKWYFNNAEPARRAWTLQKTGGEDWKQAVETAREVVRGRATQVGAVLEQDELQRLAVRYLYEGWGEPGRAQLLENNLATYLDTARGDAVQRTSTLKQLANQYGVSYSDDWYLRASQRVQRGEITEDFFVNKIKEDAKSKYKPVANLIDAGQTTRDALSQHLQSMGQLLELDPDNIDLNDPLLKKAWGGRDASNQPMVMSVYDFEREIRRDSRWSQTKNGRDTQMRVAQSFLQSLGFGG